MSNQTTEEPPAVSASEPDLYGYALSLLIVFAKRKRYVLGVPFLAAVITSAVVLLLPNIYTGVARILPPQQNHSTAATALSQLGALSGFAGQSLGIKNPNDLYVGMLASRTIADRLIAKFALQALYEQATQDDTRKALEARTRIFSGKDGIITIEFEDIDPKRAADVANAYVAELDELTQRLAVTEASQRRLFFEKQLELAKKNLAEVEVRLKTSQETSGLIMLDEQGRAIIAAIANLRGQITAKEVILAGMRAFATEKNPAYVLAQQELASLRTQLQRLEKTSNLANNGVFIPTEKVPEAGLEYVRRFRDVKYHETIFELLAKQLELARADEARDTFIVQVLDKAVEPQRKSKPKRGLIVVLVTLIAGFLVVVFILGHEALERLRHNPATAVQLQMLFDYIRGKR